MAAARLYSLLLFWKGNTAQIYVQPLTFTCAESNKKVRSRVSIRDQSCKNFPRVYSLIIIPNLIVVSDTARAHVWVSEFLGMLRPPPPRVSYVALRQTVSVYNGLPVALADLRAEVMVATPVLFPSPFSLPSFFLFLPSSPPLCLSRHSCPPLFPFSSSSPLHFRSLSP